MVTITDVIKHSVRAQSERIRRLKENALKLQPLEKSVYVSADGKTTLERRPTPEDGPQGWQVAVVKFDKVIEHMSPRHPDWTRYRAAKRQASLLLTARLIVKLGSESLPPHSALRQALKENRLQSHAGRRRARQLCFAAWRYLRKLQNRLERLPEKYAVLEGAMTGRSVEDGEEAIRV
jgi:hypothetical protein